MPKLLFCIFIFAEFAFAQMDTVPSGFSVPPGQPVPVSILSPEKAALLFHELKQAPHIPYRYPPDGCHARATAMSEIAGQQGIELIRIYAEGKLQAKALSPFQPSRWDMHVAPAAMVSQNGQRQLMVFDPSLFDHPVTEQEWKNRLLYQDPEKPYPVEIQRVYYGGRHQYLPRGKEAFRLNPDAKTITSAAETNAGYMGFQRYTDQGFDLNRPGLFGIGDSAFRSPGQSRHSSEAESSGQ